MIKTALFFTNYQSHKSLQIIQNPKVSLLFFWRELERQVRIEGTALKISDADSDAYFNSRPYESRIGAWVSAQSEIIASREILENKVKEMEKILKKKLLNVQSFGEAFAYNPIV